MPFLTDAQASAIAAKSRNRIQPSNAGGYGRFGSTQTQTPIARASQPFAQAPQPQSQSGVSIVPMNRPAPRPAIHNSDVYNGGMTRTQNGTTTAFMQPSAPIAKQTLSGFVFGNGRPKQLGPMSGPAPAKMGDVPIDQSVVAASIRAPVPSYLTRYDPAIGGDNFAPRSSMVSEQGQSTYARIPARPQVPSMVQRPVARQFAAAPAPIIAPRQNAFGGVVGAGAGFTDVRLPDGTIEKRVGARNWRNNNPGNLEYGDFAKSNGAIGTDGRFAVFPSYEAGREAKRNLLFSSGKYKNLPLDQAIRRYAPPNENNTGAYLRRVAGAAGIDPRTPLSRLNPAQQNKMLDAMQAFEGFKEGRVTRVGGGNEAVIMPAAAGLSPKLQQKMTVNGDGMSDISNAKRQFKSKLAQRYSDLATSGDPNVRRVLDAMRAKIGGKDGNAYRISGSTRRDLARRLGINGNDAMSQDMAALALLDRQGGLDAVSSGNVNDVFDIAAREWGQFDGSRWAKKRKAY